MTSSRSHGEVAASLTGRRGHSSQVSTDPNQHVTEAIGTLYVEDDEERSGGRRPLSFLPESPYQEQIQPKFSTRALHVENDSLRKAQGLHVSTVGSWGPSQEWNTKSPSSPTLSLREVQVDPSLPLASMDNPNDIAQELSNLQALRRLSMDVGNSIDPDMPPMTLTSIPSIAPRGDDDENDPSRLLWVPARVHPELAPSEFKSFLENRLQSIRRRSGDSFLTTSDEISRSELGVPNNSLRRKKSMLSRQIDTSGGRGATGYVDGAEKLERQRSRGSQNKAELSLDDLVRDPSMVVQKLAQESQGFSGTDSGAVDLPILPIAPGAGLRRSTRTTYRKGGSLRSGDKGSFSKRIAQRQQEELSEQASLAAEDPSQGHYLPRVQSEPIIENHAKPPRSVRRQQKFSQDSSTLSRGSDESPQNLLELNSPSTQLFEDRNHTDLQSSQQYLPTLEFTESEDTQEAHDQTNLTSSTPQKLSEAAERRSDDYSESLSEEPSMRSKNTSNSEGPSPSQRHVSRPSTSQTKGPNDSSSPFYKAQAEEKKAEKKGKKDRDDDTSSQSTKSSSTWKWFKGDDKDKKKDESKKSRSRSSSERTQDNVRLDLIQTSIDKTTTKGRESFVSDRDSIDLRVQEERKKESHRKGDSKKEKDGSLFSSIFGGGKKKEEKEKSRKNQHLLQVPEDPPYKPLKPDVDYNWTRFPLLEERAIYRMAHIKLANPRRSLHSQVLLSNFMYSYLAIVQTMHPQMNVPISPQQKRLEEEARRRQEEQEYLMQQAAAGEEDAQQGFDQYNFDYHRAAMQYANPEIDGQLEYVDESEIYEDKHENLHYDGDGTGGYSQEMKDYLQYQHNVTDTHHSNQGNVW